MLTRVDNHEVFHYHANRASNAAQPNVVFIHGASHDHSVWALQSRYFAYHGWNVFALDLPGHGRSGGAPHTSIEDSAQWLVRFLDAANIAQATLVGHSMGSLISLEAAALAPSASPSSRSSARQHQCSSAKVCSTPRAPTRRPHTTW